MEYSRTRRDQDARLRQYRLYFLDGVERMISHVHEFEADGDDFAIRLCDGWREGRPMELWDGTRRVKSWVRD